VSTPLLSVVSRKIHGTAGTFDINLPLTGPRGVECRSPGSTGESGFDYKLIFSFTGAVTSCGTASTGTVSSGPAANQCTVKLTGVPNAQYLTVTLTGVNVPTANFRTDVTHNGVINSSDVSTVKSKSGTALPSSP
jgi:hypothetical protein